MIFTVMRQICLSCSISCLVNVTVQRNLVVVVVVSMVPSCHNLHVCLAKNGIPLLWKKLKSQDVISVVYVDSWLA